MATALQPNLRLADRSPVHFASIISDFGLGERLAGARILDLGPGQFDFAEIAAARGAQVVGIDNDPAVIRLGEYRGYESFLLDMREMSNEAVGGPFDGLFCRWSFNAMWFEEDDQAHLEWVDSVAELLDEDGWAWLAPWNYLSSPDDTMDRQRYLEVLHCQWRGFARNGFTAVYVPPEVARGYGLSRGSHFQEGETIYVRNLDLADSLKQYIVTRTDLHGFVAATGRTLEAGVPAERTPDPPPGPTPEPAQAPARNGTPVVVTNAFVRIFDDFGLAELVRGKRVLEIGPSRFELATLARSAGAAEVVTMDRDPAVVAQGEAMGFRSIHMNPRHLKEDPELGKFDVILARGSMNAFWFSPNPSEHVEYLRVLMSFLADDGVAWIAPWNAPNVSVNYTETGKQRVVDAQTSVYLRAGFEGRDLEPDVGVRYGVGGSNVANWAIFTRGIEWPQQLAHARRLVDRAGEAGTPRRLPSSVAKPVQEIKLERGAAIVPFEYHSGLIDLIAANRDVFNVITYKDLPWEDDFDHEGSFPDEYARWEAAVRANGDERIHVLIQHDVDTLPELSMALARYEAEQGVPSNIMVFNRRLDRGRMSQGEVEFVDYPVDFDLLTELERSHGFVIGYHTNAVEQARWDLERAQEIFAADLDALRQRLTIEFFSPHGGAASPAGINNISIEVPESARRDVRWVHNRYGPKFYSSYSDGRFATEPVTDIREFVRSWQPGNRYRIMTHPQYYGNPPTETHSDSSWYMEVLTAWRDGERAFWDGVWPAALG